jgi:hypothetical protein
LAGRHEHEVQTEDESDAVVTTGFDVFGVIWVDDMTSGVDVPVAARTGSFVTEDPVILTVSLS